MLMLILMLMLMGWRTRGLVENACWEGCAMKRVQRIAAVDVAVEGVVVAVEGVVVAVAVAVEDDVAGKCHVPLVRREEQRHLN